MCQVVFAIQPLKTPCFHANATTVYAMHLVPQSTRCCATKSACIVLSQGAPADFVLQLHTVSGESADDWHLIQRSAELQAAVADLEPDRRPPVLLAPLPSADASEAEHWARAMSTASAGTGQLSSRVLAAAADRLRYLRRTR